MKLQFLVSLGAGFVCACSNGGDVEVKGGFDVAGFYLAEGEETKLLELTTEGEKLMVEGPDFRVPLASSAESLAPVIGVFEGDHLDLVAVTSDGERKLGRLLMVEVHTPEAWLSSSMDTETQGLTVQEDTEERACTPGQVERVCSIICCHPPSTVRIVERSVCIGGQWVRGGQERACCGGNICAI